MSWWYGWRDAYRQYDQHVTQKCPSPHAQMPEFVPMVWSIQSNDSARWIHIPPSSQFVLGYNEPDHVPQAHMTPQEAAMYWPMIEKAAVGIPLVAPATAGHGFHWLDQFFHLCYACRVDYLAAHSYLCNADHTIAYLKALSTRYNKKVWLTEFACPHTPDEQVQLGLMRTLLPKLEAADFVYRYSWFSGRITHDDPTKFVRQSASLFHSNASTLTLIGQFYNDFQPDSHGSFIVG